MILTSNFKIAGHLPQAVAISLGKGCCPHCGNPCAPYYECEERREYKRAYYRKLRERRGSTHYKPTAPWDSRLESKQNKGKP